MYQILFYFHSFSRYNNFWLNKQVLQLFLHYSMIYHLSNARKYCQIWLILPELCDPKAIYRENTRKLYPQPNINDTCVTINKFFI